jgi:hypothetical protein
MVVTGATLQTGAWAMIGPNDMGCVEIALPMEDNNVTKACFFILLSLAIAASPFHTYRKISISVKISTRADANRRAVTLSFITITNQYML